jgi:hypothetical protein
LLQIVPQRVKESLIVEIWLKYDLLYFESKKSFGQRFLPQRHVWGRRKVGKLKDTLLHFDFFVKNTKRMSETKEI